MTNPAQSPPLLPVARDEPNAHTHTVALRVVMRVEGAARLGRAMTLATSAVAHALPDAVKVEALDGDCGALDEVYTEDRTAELEAELRVMREEWEKHRRPVYEFAGDRRDVTMNSGAPPQRWLCTKCMRSYFEETCPHCTAQSRIAELEAALASRSVPPQGSDQ